MLPVTAGREDVIDPVELINANGLFLLKINRTDRWAGSSLKIEFEGSLEEGYRFVRTWINFALKKICLVWKPVLCEALLTHGATVIFLESIGN